VRFDAALDAALDRVNTGGLATYEEVMHELGISTSETVALTSEIDGLAETRTEGVLLGLYVGILIGRELSR
jgi:hypothetical protein